MPGPAENNAIQHQPNGGHTIVLGASRVRIESEADAEAVTRKAAAARVVEATAMNAVSSRSHSGEAAWCKWLSGQFGSEMLARLRRD